ncbi:RiPP maturation radical SAM C-methyltransferase [Alicyclobacillus macrosporangiidus]|uniref:RiPP maturation radical SAM C-methyltransferase n=1 Tax=Alicyclobacillus macrosporangiidus TaxID=392015 RepID=UPI0006911667|nr:RiPP maturation radical SAM C-methyltransferase [Alicyclobacillus macrosporangiidus]
MLHSRKHNDVVLVSMPMGPIWTPSIALGLLSSCLKEQGIIPTTKYFNLKFAGLIGVEFYTKLTKHSTVDLVGDWLFSSGLSVEEPTHVAQYVDDILRGKVLSPLEAHFTNKPYPEEYITDILELRKQIPDFLTQCLQEIIDIEPKIIGFTSVFEQHVASLVLAKMIKAELSDCLIVFGGANCEGEMGQELIRQFPFVDVVVSGEGEIVFPHLVKQFLSEGTLSVYNNMYVQSKPGLVNTALKEPPRVGLDKLPFCDYDDFFDQVKEYNVDPAVVTSIPFETSRGCWWGEKHHCTFCGLNGLTMSFRSKAAERALQELTYLVERYPDLSISVVDNILDYRYFDTFLPALASRQLNVNLFYEVKANLKKEQLLLLREAGVRDIQPGIESLSSHVLKLMRKGVTGIQNVQLLKWCKELGISVGWNILWGFPGETAEDYSEFAQAMPLLFHLDPPAVATHIRLDRFSPYFNEADKIGFVQLHPYRASQLIYHGLDEQAIYNLSYYFRIEPDFVKTDGMAFKREMRDLQFR